MAGVIIQRRKARNQHPGEKWRPSVSRSPAFTRPQRSDYWPQKALALATIQAAISNQLMKDAGLKLDLTFGAVEGQTGHSVAI
jgi:hypothetical protein